MINYTVNISDPIGMGFILQLEKRFKEKEYIIIVSSIIVLFLFVYLAWQNFPGILKDIIKVIN